MDKLQFGVRAWPAMYTLPHPLYPTPETWKKSLNKSALASTKNQKGKKKSSIHHTGCHEPLLLLLLPRKLSRERKKDSQEREP